MMNFRLPRLSARSLTTGAAVVGVVSLAIGAHAALNKRSLDAARATHMAADHGQLPAAGRYALVIGNGHYPDARAPLAQPINDARAMTGALRREGFEVDVVEDASRDDMLRAVDRMKQRVGKDSVVMLYFGGYGIQAGRENYMIPVDARIWNEADVRRSGVSIESVLGAMKDSGVRTKLAIVDASRRNPYERRFRAYSHGLAPIDAPSNALVMTSMTPGKVIEDGRGDNSVLVSALLGSTSSRFASAEAAFTKTRLAVTHVTNGAQIPSVSSSLVDDVSLSPVADATPNSGG